MLPVEFGPAAPLPAALLEVRATIERALVDLLAVPDDGLTRTWRWRGETGRADVRYGFYRLYELLEQIRRRLDDWLDAGIGWLIAVDAAADLGAPAVWAGYEVTAQFRLHRWTAHLREHTVQIEKTLALLGRQPREVERLVRLVLGAYGRLEGAALGLAEAPAPLIQVAQAVHRHAEEMVSSI